MIWLYATLLSAILFGFGSFLLKVGSHRNYPEASMLLGLYIAGSLLLLSALLFNGHFEWNGLICFFAILVGLGSYYGNSFLVKAYDLGPASLTAPLMSLSIVLVILLSAIVYHEDVSQFQYLGIAIMVGAAALLGCKFDMKVIKSKWWLAFVVLGILFLALREGGLKVAHETGLDNIGVLFFSYALATGLAIATLMMKPKNPIEIGSQPALHRHAFLLGSVIGILSAIGMGLIAFAITEGPAAIIVPIFSGRNIITLFLIGFFFKEKLSTIQWIAVGLMILGVLFIT